MTELLGNTVSSQRDNLGQTIGSNFHLFLNRGLKIGSIRAERSVEKEESGGMCGILRQVMRIEINELRNYASANSM